MNVWDEEYWLTCHHFPTYKISSFGKIHDTVFDEDVIPSYSRGELRANLKYGPDEFRGAIWQMMYATFWQGGWGIDVTVSYRDDDPKNLSIFNLLFEKEGKPLLYRLDDSSGLWVRRRGNQARRVQIIETGEEFDSVPQLAITKQMDRNSVYMCLRGEQKSHYGFTFRYLS